MKVWPYTWKWLALAAVLMMAWVLRGENRMWDEGYLLHPDERFLLMTVQKLEVPGTFLEYLDGGGKLNPRNHGVEHFAYGTLPTSLLAWVAKWRGIEELDGLAELGRVISAICDVVTVGLTFLLGFLLTKSRWRYWGGWCSALLYALTVFAVQQAHFFTVDAMCAMWVTGTLVLALLYLRTGNVWVWLLAGVCSGAAMGCKISTLPLLLLLGGVLGLQWLGKLTYWRRGVGLGLGLVVSFLLGWRVTSPDVFEVGWQIGFAKNWLIGLEWSADMATGKIDFPPGFQWAARMPYAWPIYNLVVWGLGPFLGMAAGVGTVVALVVLYQQARDSWRPGAGIKEVGAGLDLTLLLVTGWVVGMVAGMGGQFVSSMRYFLPLYPCLAVLAVWWVSRLKWRKLVGAVVLGGTAMWCWGFVTIYGETNSRVQATEWIIENVPAGATVSHEYWDDRLPLYRRGELANSQFRFVEMRWTDEDTLEKLERAVDWLEETDYVVISSDRGLLNLPRMPLRFPMTSKYYQSLFSGELGFELVKKFEVLPKFLGVKLQTPLWAEEAFSVYDHPRVFVFRKTDAFDVKTVREALGEVDWKKVVNVPARAVNEAPTGLLLPDKRWQQQKAGKSWDEVFFLSGEKDWVYVVLWAGVILVFGLLAWPWLFGMMAVFPDRGWAFARMVGLLLFACLWWVLSSSGWAGSWELLMVALVLGVIASVLAWWVMRCEMARWWRQNQREVWKVEGLFLGAYLLMVLVRGMNPDLWHPNYGGEKMMDTAYFTAVARAESFPPYQPWFSGGFINYYYWGFVPAAMLAKLTGTPPEIATQLVFGVWFGMVATAVYGMVRCLTSNRLMPWLAVWLMLLAGSWNQWRLVFKEKPMYIGEWFWAASRGFSTPKDEIEVITEFPLFTFLYGDLHAHLLAMPWFLLVVAMVVAMAKSASRWLVWQMLLAALACRVLSAANAWDTPAAMLLFAGGLGLACKRRVVNPSRGLVFLAISGVMAMLMFWPFHHWFAPGYSSVSIWKGSRTGGLDYLLHYGSFLVPMLVGVMLLWWQGVALPWLKKWQWGLALLLIWSLLLAIGWGGLVMMTVAMLFFVLLWRADDEADIVLLIGGVAIVVAIVPEFLVLDGDSGRMNTVFKLHFQSWQLLSIALPAAIPVMWRQLPSTMTRGLFATSMVASIVGGWCYVITAPLEKAKVRFHDKNNGWSLDGLAFMKDAEYRVYGKTLRLRHDARVIEWLRKNVKGTAVIAEAQTRNGRYDWNSRIATFTGLPTPLGWRSHINQQRYIMSKDELKRREKDMRDLYVTADLKRKREILDWYEIKYVVVTHVERAMGSDEGLDALDEMAGLRKVLDQSWARIYEVSSLQQVSADF